MKIPRERKWLLPTIWTFLLIGDVKLQGERTYDTSEWIPITPKSLQASSSEIVEQKVASDRVLSLDAPAQKFFPDEDYEYRKRKPNQLQQFVRESPPKKVFDHPRPRKLKHPSDYKFETPPPPPAKNQPQINYYNGENMSPYVFEQTQPARPIKPQQNQQNYYVPVQQLPNQRPLVDSYVAVPSVNPQVPAPDAPNLYEQYQLPFNASFYQSLNPSSINNDFYQAISNNSQNIQPQIPLGPVHQRQQPTSSKSAPIPNPSVEQETVQLVYVPVENLKPNRPASQDSRSIYQQVEPIQQEQIPLQTAPPLQNQVLPTFKPLNQPRQESFVYNTLAVPENQPFVYPQADAPRQEKLVGLPEAINSKQSRLESIQQDFIQQALQAHKLQQQFRDDINPLKQEIVTTVAPPKRKPHQPPLAVFLESQQKAEISDVLSILRNAKTISVQDKVTPDSPKLFIGPSNLDSPEGYTKFPLPYLNNINGNRIERKIDQLPFFVAPVSYKAPPGYSKITLPSPHVGSVVVSVPVTSTTPEPLLFNQNQLNQFTFTSPAYSPIEQPRPTRPQQNIFDTYSVLSPSGGQYRSTTATPATESPLIPPVRDIFENNYAPKQPDQYYVQQTPNQQSVFDIYRPQIQEQPRYPSREETRQTPSSTVKPKQDSREQTQLPDINPLELAINEFELHQINDQAAEHNKVKHSTTRRPQSNYDDSQSVSNTRPQPTRGRHTYDGAPATEPTVSRGRKRGRGRGSTSRPTTTTTTTTAAPYETDRYTVLEEFEARGPSTENYEVPTAEIETEAPRRSTTQFSGNPYLPEEQFEGRPQLPLEDSQQVQFQPPKIKTEILEEPKRQRVSSVETQEPQNIQPTNQVYSGNTEIENIPANVYSLGQAQTYESKEFERPRNLVTPTRLVYENIEPSRSVIPDSLSTERTKLEEPTPTHVHRFSPEVINYENREPNQGRQQEKPNNYQPYEVNINDETDIRQVYPTDTYQRTPSNSKEAIIEENKSKQQSGEEPPGFIDSLLQPNFDQTYISLQDQAVRSLLVPNLLAPTTKLDSPSTPPTREVVVSPTEAIVEVPSSTEPDIITTTRASRTRGRSRARPATTDSSGSSAPKRTSGRRRPVSRTSTERVSSSTEYSSREDNAELGSNEKQRFRTRGRPLQNEITDRISTTQDNINAVQVLNNHQTPQSYMQFEHSIDDQQIITINPNTDQDPEIKEYHQVYSLSQQPATENQQIILEYDNTKAQPTPILDVQVDHVVPEDIERSPQVLTKPAEEETYVRYNNANIKSGGVLINNKQETTTRASTARANKGRTRGRSRFATSTTTSRPVTRITARPTSAASRATTTPKEEQEFYGFTRQPSYTPSNLNIQASRASPVSSRNEEKSVQFAGERSKYSPRQNTPHLVESENVETPRPRIRTRTRAPPRKTTNNYRQSDNDVHSARGSEQVTRRSSTTTRTRGRGSSHYTAPENVKRESEDEDVANQNYPVNFLQKLDASTSRSTTAGFQITINPLDQEADDQSPYASIYSPNFVPKPNDRVDPNSLPSDDKPATFKPNEVYNTEPTEIFRTSEEPQALALIHTTQNSQQLVNDFTGSEVDKVIADLEKIKTLPTEEVPTTLNPTEQLVTKKKGRRRGVWKLVKHRPVDPLEASESQNYHSVLNAFESIGKLDPYLKSGPGAEKPNGDKHLNKELLNSKDFDKEINSFSDKTDESFKVDDIQEHIEDFVTLTTNSETTNTEPATKAIAEEIITTTPSTIKTQENILDTIYEMFGIFDKPEKKKNETTNSETTNAPTTTIVNPTFPEEITEVPTTEKVAETITSVDEFKENIKNNEQDLGEKSGGDNLDTTETILPTTLITKQSTKPYEVEPWQMREVKTSTSTEVSHETEICYKGRCVKSREKKKHK